MFCAGLGRFAVQGGRPRISVPPDPQRSAAAHGFSVPDSHGSLSSDDESPPRRG